MSKVKSYAIAIFAAKPTKLCLATFICNATSPQEAKGVALEALEENFPKEQGYTNQMMCVSDGV